MFFSPRVDFSVLPLLFLGLFAFQLDRMNLASALTGGFGTDINISQATVNLGNQLMFMGIVVFEIPCNMALQKVRTTSQLASSILILIGNLNRSVLGSGFRLRSSPLAYLLLCKYSSVIEEHFLPHGCF